jgi:hypothetical protein
MARLRPRLTFANVVSVMALFIALGGGSYAAVKLKANQVKSKNIAPDAVQGIDANESSFGQVPSANQANNANQANSANQANTAATAGDAETVDGFTPADFQFGNGFDDAIAGFLNNGETGGIFVFEGAVGVACAATPEIVYQDIGPDPFETDLWVDGVHAEVPDQDPAGPFSLNNTDQGTAQVHIWGGGGTVAHVVASAVWDGGNTECRVAFTSQENLDTGASAASTSARAERGLDRGGPPGDWVTPERGP